MSEAEVEGLWQERILPALEQCGAQQAKWLVSESPADRFIELLRAALSSSAAHLAHTDGKRPDSDIALACGWRDDDPLCAGKQSHAWRYNNASTPCWFPPACD